MLWRTVHLFVAALAAACLLFQTKAGSIQPVRRAVVSNEAQMGRLQRRWWFFWSGSLDRLSPREENKFVRPSKIRSHPPAADCDYQMQLDRLAHSAPEFLPVSVEERSSSSAASGATPNY